MALIVVVSHCSLVYDLPLGARLTIDAVVNPHAAVIFFFVLSGYVLQGSLVRGKATVESAIGFYVRRIFRLVPLVAVVSALALTVTLALGEMPVLSGWLKATLDPALVATPSQIALAFVGLSAVLLPPVWTIMVELLGSLYMPIHHWIQSSIRYGNALAVALLLGLTVAISLAYSDSLLRFLFYFALGAALYAGRASWFPVLRSRPRLSRRVALASVLLLFGFRSLWFLGFDQRLVPVLVDYFNVWRGLLEGLFAALLIASVVAMSGGVRWLRGRGATSTGDLSFGIYLFHFPVMSGVAWALYRLFGTTGASPLADATLLLGLTMLIVYPLSWAAYRWVERPGIEFARTISRAPQMAEAPAV